MAAGVGIAPTLLVFQTSVQTHYTIQRRPFSLAPMAPVLTMQFAVLRERPLAQRREAKVEM